MGPQQSLPENWPVPNFLVALFSRALVTVCLGCFLALPTMAEDAAILTAPAKLRAGGRASFTVRVFDAQSHASLAREITAILRSADGSEQHQLFGGTVSGQQHVEFEVPASQVTAFVLSVQVAGVANPLEITTSLERTPAILIETDKPIYKPSQKIQGRVVLLSSSLRPVEDEVEVTVHDAKGLRVARFQLASDRFGVVPFSLELASELNLGTWKIRARSHSAESVRDVRVEEYTLPRFEIGLDLDKSWALVDEPVAGSVDARYFFGKGVEGVARVRALRWVGTWEEYAASEGPLSEGRRDFQLPPVGFATGTVANSGQGTVILETSVIDSTGHEQTTSDLLTITEAPVVVTIVSPTDSLKPGIPITVYVRTETPEGLPLDQDLTVSTHFYAWNEELLETRQFPIQSTGGGGAFLLDAPQDTAFARVEASAVRENRRTRVEIFLGSAYSPSRSFLSLTRIGSGPVRIGDVLTFSAVSTEAATVYYEVYAGGRTVLSDAGENESFSFAVTPEMVPRARVVAYKISASNEVAADSTTFQVQLPVSASLSAGFDAEQVRPGEAVEVFLDSGTESPTLLGVSIVDESVLSLGNSRLHLAEVFAELERRFLEPQAEIHQDDPSPVAPIGFFAESPGALDVLHDAGLQVATTPNIVLPSGQEWDLLDFGGGLVLGPPPAAEAVRPADLPPRLRQFFPETWVWAPTLLTDEDGRAKLTLTAPDSITGWKLVVVGTCPEVQATDSGILFGESDLTVFQEFFVEPSVPYAVVRGETFPVKVDVFNYLDHPQIVRLSLEGSEGFEILGSDYVSTTAPANSASAVSFQIRPSAIGEFPLRITAQGESAGDAVLRPLRVIAEGVPAEQVLNSVLEPGVAVPLTLDPPLEMVEGSLRSLLFLSPSPVAQSMKGVSSLLDMPFGCGEQNMIFLAPDIEILKYLREIGELAPEIRAEAEHFINVGYQRQLTYRTDDGGFSAFGGAEGSLWLTAFVLSTFSGARDVRDIDETVLVEAASMIISRQLSDGSFQTDDFLIHKEMDGGLENLFAMTAYVTKALAEYGGTETVPVLSLAGDYLANNLSLVWNDAYALSIGAVSLQGIEAYRDVSETIIDRLLELAIREGTGIHWADYPVETTGYAMLALLGAGGGVGRLEAQGALDWLSTQRNSLGGYGNSTQDTVVALRALFEAARKLHRDLAVEVSVLENGRPLFTVQIDETNFDLMQQFELPVDSGNLELRSVGQGNVGYQLVQRYNLPGHLLPPPSDMLLEVAYRADHVEVDDLVDVEVRLRYTGLKEKTGMVIVDVGVPTGFEAVGSSLRQLEHQEIVERVEVAGRKVIFYIEGLERDQELAFRFQVRALFPVRAEGPVSTAYEYYDAGVRAFDRSKELAVLGPAPEIDALSSGTLAPGQTVTVTGKGFAAGPLTILIGGLPIDSYEVLDDSTLILTVPRLPAGAVELSISNDSGSATWNDAGRLVVSPLALYFPVYPNRQGSFAGFAVVNHSEQTAHLGFQVRDALGNPVSAGGLPVGFALAPGRQMALLGDEIFTDFPQLPNPIWVEMSSDNAKVSGYSLFGDLQEMDNLGGASARAMQLVFSRVLEGTSAYRGQAALTMIGVANPGSGSATVRLTLRALDRSSGQALLRSHDQEIPAGGLLRGNLSDLFGSLPELSSAWVVLDVLAGGGVVGYQLVEFPEGGSAIGFAPQAPAPVTRWFAPQVAHAFNVLTDVNLVNISQENRTASISLFAEDGRPLTEWRNVSLEAGEVFRDSLASCFDLSEEDAVFGHLVVESSGPGILGDVLIADPQRLRFATGYPLQQQSGREVVLSQVANGAGIFTGIAVLNPSSSGAEIDVEVFSADGISRGREVFALGPRQSVSRLLTELVPSSDGLVGGYIIFRSTSGVLLQEILGENRLEHFSIVVPAAVR